MKPDDYQKVSDLFEQLQDLPESAQITALEAACASNPQLRSYLARLLEADRGAGTGFLERPALEVAAGLMSSESLQLPEPGALAGNYRLGSRIGSGGMAVVFDGEDLHLGRRVAIKLLPGQGTPEASDRIQRFRREARTVSSLNHPNIVSIFDAASAQGFDYIAMEFVEGRTLRQVIAAGPEYDERTILDVIGQVASALCAAHQAGIVHRDIKPENIMVRPDGFVKVLDFGLAKLFESASDPQSARLDFQTRPGNVAGTIQYLSPEQLSGAPATPRSDLFSLGVVAYELATGVRPFDGLTDAVVYNSILTRKPPPPSTVRPSLGHEVDEVILRAIEKDPDLRFQTATDLRSACRRLSRDYISRTDESGAGRTISTGVGLTKPSNAGGAPAEIDLLKGQARSAGRRFRPLFPLIALFACVIPVAIWRATPVPEPRATNIVQITHGAQPSDYFVTDGTRIYYASGKADQSIQMFQIGTNGGDPVLMPRLRGMVPLDISPNRSELLLKQSVDGVPAYNACPLWVADALGSSPRPLGGVSGAFARWSPSGDRIVYSAGPDLHIVKRDGSQSWLLPTPAGVIESLAWSPDGQRIRFSVFAAGLSALWEVKTDGSNLHAVLPAWRDRSQNAGPWTPDGGWFVFPMDAPGGRRDLWVLREQRRWFEGPSKPAPLTNGPLQIFGPFVSPDGKRIFFRGVLEMGELVRYDRTTSRWQPDLGGLAAMDVEYSRDGKSIAFIAPPGRSVWRAAADGSGRVQLTEPPLEANNPRWSPDGARITFFGSAAGKPSRVYVVPARGGAVRGVTNGEGGPGGETDGSWAADGASLVYGVQSTDQAAGGHQIALRIVDLQTQHSWELPGSRGLWSPRWSPDGRSIVALGFPNMLWLYDLKTRTKAQLTTIRAGFPSWSADSKYVYFEDSSSSAWYRVRASNKKVERLASLKGLNMPGFTFGWVGLTPDGSLISTRDIGSVDIYALDWDRR